MFCNSYLNVLINGSPQPGSQNLINEFIIYQAHLNHLTWCIYVVDLWSAFLNVEKHDDEKDNVQAIATDHGAH